MTRVCKRRIAHQQPSSAFPMNRAAYIRLITHALGVRRLVYFGTRGADARTLTDLPSFEQIFSQVAPSGLAGVEESCLETMTAVRVDLDSYSVDLDSGSAVVDLRGRMLDLFETRSAVIPYRSCALLASACFPRSDRVIHLGNFHEKQTYFEHKPWVETSLSRCGIRIVPWRYYADNERALIEEALEKSALVVRSNRSDGGTGVRFVPRSGDLTAAWPQHLDGFIAAAPFLDGLPLNVNACVYADGTVAMFGVSVQLIGITSCTTRRFGYCGNDFSAVSSIDDAGLAELDAMVRRVGRWLASEGYRGAFGIDSLYVGGNMFLVELNPRFQGSSRLAAAMDSTDQRADMFLAHIGAFLGLGVPDEASLPDLARRLGASHVVVHAPEQRVAPELRHAPAPPSADLEPEPGITVNAGAMLCDLVFPGSVTRTGYSLSDGVEKCIQGTMHRFPARPEDSGTVQMRSM